MLARPPPRLHAYTPTRLHARTHAHARPRAREPASLRTRTRTREAKIQKSKIRKPNFEKSFYSEKGDPLKKALKPGAAPADTLSVSQ